MSVHRIVDVIGPLTAKDYAEDLAVTLDLRYGMGWQLVSQTDFATPICQLPIDEDADDGINHAAFREDLIAYSSTLVWVRDY